MEENVLVVQGVVWNILRLLANVISCPVWCVEPQEMTGSNQIHYVDVFAFDPRRCKDTRAAATAFSLGLVSALSVPREPRESSSRASRRERDTTVHLKQ